MVEKLEVHGVTLGCEFKGEVVSNASWRAAAVSLELGAYDFQENKSLPSNQSVICHCCWCDCSVPIRTSMRRNFSRCSEKHRSDTLSLRTDQIHVSGASAALTPLAPPLAVRAQRVPCSNLQRRPLQLKLKFHVEQDGCLRMVGGKYARPSTAFNAAVYRHISYVLPSKRYSVQD